MGSVFLGALIVNAINEITAVRRFDRPHTECCVIAFLPHEANLISRKDFV